MKIGLIWAALAALCFSGAGFCQCTVRDDAGHTITLQRPAQRIISVAPDLTEDLFAIGAQQAIIGVVAGTDYPSLALKIPVIGAYTGLDIERIIQLKPDLVLSWGGTFTRQILLLQKMGVPVYVSTPVYLQDVTRTLLNLGCLTGHDKEAQAAIQQFNFLVGRPRTRCGDSVPAKPIKVYFQLGASGLLTINHQSWINQAIELCGGQNIFANASLITPHVSWESILAANPDVVLTDSDQPGWQNRWLRWKSINAVKNHRLYSLHADWVDRAGPRLAQGVAEICARISGLFE